MVVYLLQFGLASVLPLSYTLPLQKHGMPVTLEAHGHRQANLHALHNIQHFLFHFFFFSFHIQ